MADIVVEQALYMNVGGYRFVARSPGFFEEWLPTAEHLCTGFGERPAGVACPHAVLAQPFGPDFVAVVQVADQGSDDAGRPGALGFHVLVLPRKAYVTLIGDPFAVAEHFPPPWTTREELPALSWPGEPLPPRDVAEVQRILKGKESAALLGGAQAVVDGGKLVLEQPAPANDFVRDLWQLLPTRTRAFLWPASFVFDNSLGFHVLAVPKADPLNFEGYLTLDQAAEYPQGRYELDLQIAAEAGDQPALNALMTRRNATDALRLALVVLALFAALAIVVNVVDKQMVAPAASKPLGKATPPLAKKYAKLAADTRVKLNGALRGLAEDLQAPSPRGNPTIEERLDALDAFLGTPDPLRNPGPLKSQGDTERRLRVLLWKHHVDGFDDDRLNALELAERLRQKVVRKP